WKPSQVIAAVPWHALPTLFEGDVAPLAPVADCARAVAASPIVTVNLWFDRSIVGEPFIGFPGRAMQWVFEEPARSGDGTFHVSMVASGASPLIDRSNEGLIEEARRELFEARPSTRTATLVRATAVREPRATF